jgi:hypothetical protein
VGVWEEFCNNFIVTQAAVTLTLGVATLYLAFRQYRLDQRQAKLEQRRARVEIYEGLQSTIQAVLALLTQVTQDEVPREALTDFTKALARATPLLDDEDMIEYLSQLWLHALNLRVQQLRVARPGLSDEEREKIEAEINDTLEWLAKQEREVLSRFRNYLSR